MKQEQAEAIGQDALIWLAGQPEALAGFLDWSGLAPGDIAARSADQEFLGFVLDFVLLSDATVLGFAADAGIAPDLPARARACLPGGAVPDWT